MQFVDLKTQQHRIRSHIEGRIGRVLDHGQYILGPEVFELEENLADYVGVSHAISCSSGTDALLMALMALGIGPGDAVLTTAFSFFATAEVIRLAGAMPVFVDIDAQTFNIDPDCLERVLRRISQGSDGRSAHRERGPSLKPKAVVAVDLFGLPADYKRINAIAKHYGLHVIEDAAQSFGADYQGKKAGALADIACTSFYPAKPLGTYGDGGMCFTDDSRLAEVLRSIGNHGIGEHRFDHIRLGINGRLDTLQAAILLAKMEVLADELDNRRRIASFYHSELNGCSGLRLPRKDGHGCHSAWAQYSVMTETNQQRNRLRHGLKQLGIPTVIYYPTPLNRYEVFPAPLITDNDDCPASQWCADRIFSIPVHPYLTTTEQRHVVETIRSLS
jgi:dTDP-4-amino-4,6-dideoxygalactose transaminase